MFIERFRARAKVLLAPHVMDIGFLTYLGKLATSAVKFELEVKTGRCPMGGDDMDALGVESPSVEAEAACRMLASEFGLNYIGFEACEKGWGSFQFGVI